MECKCLGGGKMEHNSQEKKIRVFGESTVSSSDLKKTKKTTTFKAGSVTKCSVKLYCYNVNAFSFISRHLVKRTILCP